MHAVNPDDRVDKLDERLRRIASLIRTESTRTDVQIVYKGLVVANLAESFVNEAETFANLTQGKKQHNKKRQLVSQLIVAIDKVLKSLVSLAVGTVRANLLLAAFDLASLARVYNPSAAGQITQQMKGLLSELNDEVGDSVEYEMLWKRKLDQRERIAFGNSEIGSLTYRISNLTMNDTIGTVDENVNTLTDVLKLSGVTAKIVPAGVCSFAGLERVLKQDEDLLTNSAYAQSFVALCIAAVVGHPATCHALNDKYSLQIRAKACYAVQGKLAMQKFSLMGHVLIHHGPKTAELEAVREWLGARSLWSAKTGKSRASKSIIKYQKRHRNTHPYDGQLTQEIYSTITATLDPATLS